MKQRFKPEASFDLHRRGAEVGSSELSGALSVRSRPARGLMPHCHTQHLHLHLPIHVSGRKRERAKCVHGLNPCPFLKSPPTPPCDFLFHLLDQSRVTWQFLPSRAIENAVFSQVKKNVPVGHEKEEMGICPKSVIHKQPFDLESPV